MCAQARRMASGTEVCAWSPTEITAASEALDRLGRKSLKSVGDEGLAGLLVIFGLALRRAAPNSPGISDAQRTAYATLYGKLLTVFSDLKARAADCPLSLRAPLEVCTALIKTHALRAVCPLLAAAASPLLSSGGTGQPQARPPRRVMQASLLVLTDAGYLLSFICDVLDTLNNDDHKMLSTALHEELAASGLLEHWARLALALASWEEGKEEAAIALEKMGKDLKSLIPLRPTDLWARTLVSGSCPSLAYLLSSHLVALAAELDGGPTYGLPTAPADGSAAGASSSSSPPPKARPPIPLLDSQGYVLRPRQPLGLYFAAPALGLWSTVLSHLSSTLSGSFMTYPAVHGSEDVVPTNYQRFVRTVFAKRLRQHGPEFQKAAEPVASAPQATAEAGTAAAAAAAREQAALDQAQEAERAAEGCAGMLAALRRREPLLDCSAAFQLGMRLARAAAFALRGCPDLLLSTSTGKWSTEAAVQALIAAHDTAAWTDDSSPPLQLQGAEAAGRLSREDAGVLAWRGLDLARLALGIARNSCDGGCRGIAPWLEPRLRSWWRAAVAWAGLWHREAGKAAACPVIGLICACRILDIRSYVSALPPGAPPADQVPTDARAAFLPGAGAYLPTIEALLRHPNGPRDLRNAPRGPPAACAALLRGTQPPHVASFATTLAKRLRLAQALGAPTASGTPGGGSTADRIRCTEVTAEVWRLVLSTQVASYHHPALWFPSDGEAPSPCGEAAEAEAGWPLAAAHVALTALPAAAALGRALAPGVLRRLDGGGALELEGDGGALGDVVALLLDWLLPLLVAAEGRWAGAGAVGGAAVVSAAVDAADSAASSAASSVAADSTAPTASEREWSAFLWTELDPAWALRVGLRLAETAEACHTPLKDVLWALAVRAPSRLQAMVAAAGTEEAQGGETAGGGLRGPSLSALRRVLGPGGALSEPALLALIEAVVGCGGGASEGPLSELSPKALSTLASVSLMPPPSHARRSLPGCSNPACPNLAGPSEASLRVKRCGGCEAARYCCRECQAAHWEAGHKRECRTAAKEAQAAVIAG
ncbi:hypothetical protein HYH03_011602 [Edaphochlamys debaryana]|uniref:MYND-type domain-containing protein n=1 Tax=Edaphochlamys debaryana TaxID=47281 RepID=A0A836BWB4_9CHLO|nr:hypothetical protein HYH03_011602 [Edaphochlamys debaryana]|eukprot:KAG2489973.1 hypothetical protein HYH03_011602 [Edaphochlamys debaryana]